MTILYMEVLLKKQERFRCKKMGFVYQLQFNIKT